MKTREALPLLALLALAGGASGETTSVPVVESPLTRHYADGETLRYRIDGTHSMQGSITDSYHAEADALVKESPEGVFHEELQWTHVQRMGRDVPLPPDSLGFRQSLSLDPKFKSSVPDLSRLNSSLYGPILDMLTFYSDYWLAVRKGLRLKAGDHAFVPYGKPSSWADGTRVVSGYDCIDFDLTVAAVDPEGKTATLKVRHVPPTDICGSVPAEWMRKPVSDAQNNWFQVEKKGEDRYDAGVGKETFDAEVEILLPSGVIKSAAMFNPVELEQRTCSDAALSNCGAPEKVEIVRRITLALER